MVLPLKPGKKVYVYWNVICKKFQQMSKMLRQTKYKLKFSIILRWMCKEKGERNRFKINVHVLGATNVLHEETDVYFVILKSFASVWQLLKLPRTSCLI